MGVEAMNVIMGNGNDGIRGSSILPGEPAAANPRRASVSATIPETRELLLVIIDNRALDRQCLARCITSTRPEVSILAFDTVEEWRRHRDSGTLPAAILLNIGSARISDRIIADQIKMLASEFPTPIIILADSDDPTEIIGVLDCGAGGYIPSSVSIDVCIEAIALAMAGGIFVPASCLLAMRQFINTAASTSAPLNGIFTARQAEVVEALRRGKANKIIAYELNMRESTVKVHIRNIMKKVKATNRTEVAYKINDMLPVEVQPATRSDANG
jgi:DNA-binding NarL/FixJ family response regulator